MKQPIGEPGQEYLETCTLYIEACVTPEVVQSTRAYRLTGRDYTGLWLNQRNNRKRNTVVATNKSFLLLTTGTQIHANIYAFGSLTCELAKLVR